MTTTIVAARHGVAEVRDGAAGAYASLRIEGDSALWLQAPLASGRVAGVAPDDPHALARRWAEQMQRGFVAADAALLALWNGHGTLPTLTWGEAESPVLASQTAAEGLYAIVDDVPRLLKVLDAGIRLVQLRIKTPGDADAAWFAGLARQMRDALAASRGAGATLVVNDHWRLAAELGADAVHLGQEDLGALGHDGLAALAASGLALGVSSHAVWELCRARSLAPALIACGPVWPTTTKVMPWRPQGLDNLGWWCAHAGAPVVAIGGILEPDKVREAARAGANTVCIVRGLGDEPRQTLPAFQASYDEGVAERTAAPAWPHPSLDPSAEVTR